MSARETRSMICECVNSLLTDIPSVSAQLQKEASCTPQSEVVLQFLLHCVDAFPQCYVNIDHNNSTSNPALTDELKEFTKWVISRLLRILSSKECKVLHEKVIDVIDGIFQLIKGKDLTLYREFINEVIDLMKDLKIIMENVFDSGRKMEVSYKICITRFQRESLALQETFGDNEIESKLIEAENIDQVISLFDACCMILRRSITGIFQYSSYKLTNIWHIMIYRLQLISFFAPSEPVRLIHSVLKMSPTASDKLVEDIFRAMITFLENVLSFSSDSKRLIIEAGDFEDVLLQLLQYLFGTFKKKSTIVLSTFEMNNLAEKFSNCFTTAQCNKEITLKYEAIICYIIEWMFEISSMKKIIGISKRVLLNLLETLFNQIGFSEKQKVYSKVMIVVLKSSDLSNVIISRKRKVSHLPKTEDNVYQKLFYDRFQWISNSLNDTISSQTFDGKPLLLINGVEVCLLVLSSIRFKISQDVKNLAMCTGRHIFTLIHNLPRMLNDSHLKIDILLSLMNSLDSLLQLVNSSDETVDKDEFLQNIYETVYLPWLDNIDPPWFDWKPYLHKESELRSLKYQLNSSICIPYINMAIRMLLQLPNDEHELWKIQIFRIALTNTNKDIQLMAIQYLPMFLSKIGVPGHCLVDEEVAHLLRLNSPVILQLLASTCGVMACSLSGQCQVEIHNNKNDFVMESNSSLNKFTTNGCSLICEHCDGGKQEARMVNVRIFKAFFQLLKPDSSKKVKLSFIRNLRRLMNHIANEKEPVSITSPLWSAYLELMTDRDLIIRLNFSNVIDAFVKRKDLIHIQQLLVNRVKEYFLTASNHEDLKVLETIIITLGSIGKAAQDDLLLVVVISLLECVITQRQSIGAVAFDQVKAVARQHNISCQEFMVKYRLQICDFLINKFRETLMKGNDHNSIIEMISEISNVLEFKDQNAFLQNNLKVLLPRIIRYADKSSSIILRIIAKKLNINRREMLFYNFKFSFSYLVRNCSGSELEKTLKYLQTETDVELGSLLLSECQSVFNQLLLYLSVNKEQVFTGLNILAHNDSTYHGPKEIKNNKQMAEFLKPKLLGVLAFFNFILTYGEIEERCLALQSLVSLMQLMGPLHITAVRLKVMAVIRLGMKIQQQNVAELCCSAWHYFVHNVDLKTLGPLLGQITVTLFLFLDTFPRKTAEIFKFLVVENKSTMKEYFKDIYFMPDHEALKDINKVLESSHAVIKTIVDFKSQLVMAINGSLNEYTDVKKYALKKLIQLLSKHQNYLQELILSSETVHPVITKLVSMLVNSCKESDEDIRHSIGICMGLLGAIDPGRLEISNDSSLDEFVIYEHGIEDDKFAFDLINELCRAFLAAIDTRAQDCSAYAIQEVLRFFKCSESNNNTTGYAIWQQFPEQTQEVLKPHLHSKYVHSSSDKWTSITKPIFGSNKGKSFKEWICTWVPLLISQINKDRAARVFRPCTSIVKHDLKSAQFILPHALLYGIIENDQIHHDVLLEIDTVLKSATDKQHSFTHSSIQVIFSILDYLHVWVQKAKEIRYHKQECNDLFNEENEMKVEMFLQSVPKSLLSSVAFHCNATARALMYLELYIDNQEGQLESNLELLQKIYYSLNEPDGINGIAAVRKRQVTLHEQIIEHESSGELRDAAACYEKAVQLEPNQVAHHKGLLNCLIRLGQLNTAVMDASGVISKRETWTEDIRPYQSEAAWRLGQWDTLKENLDGVSDVGNWSIALGKLLVHLKDQKMNSFEEDLERIRQEQMKSLSSTGLDLGEKSYTCIVRLHMLEEIEQCFKLLNDKHYKESKLQDLILLWEQRYQATQTSYSTCEQILSLRRVLLDLFPSCKAVTSEKDNCWLRIAKIARKAGHFQTSYNSLLNVIGNGKTDLIIERNKWIWSQGDKHKALLSLEKDASYIQRSTLNFEEIDSSYSKENIAKVLLRLGRWMEESESHEPQPILNQYKDVVGKNGEWEKSHFFLAKYYQKVMNAYEDKSKIKITDFVPFVIRHYASSLQYGCKYIYESMPTLLTLWLDFGAKGYHMDQDKDSTHHKKVVYRERLQSVNKVIHEFSTKLPPYQFLTAFSQLISRICHPSPLIWELLEEIISRIFIAYKQQSFWNIVAVSKHSLKLADRLLEVCNKPCRKDTKLTMSNDFQQLKRMLCDRNFPPIMIPLQSTLTVILPSGHGVHHNHTPFPDSCPTFTGLQDTIEVLRSLQKPKKVVIIGSDGKKYPMMCKPKDDLRKDGRLMEFNSLVNKLLLRDPECRRRQLHIRTYAVIPLSEDCGLLEWVSNTTGLRQIVDMLFKEKNITYKPSELRKLYNNMNSSDLRNKVEIFKNQIMPRYPPVFPEWFLRTFPNPSKWYMARLSYCRTTAVISMVGYTLGLGDRHGENILFDSANGDCFHVDFNCLFNKGETFECPERVPFRLTQQLVAAMGSLGYEGIFRRSCEITMKLMRNQKDSLLSVLNAFLYDPLVEWTKEKRKQSMDTGEFTNEKALVILRNVEDRLDGYCVSMKNLRLNLSIEGQVHQLIKEATSLENLSQMYIGWAAYL
eukprot:gene8012-8872_t